MTEIDQEISALDSQFQDSPAEPAQVEWSGLRFHYTFALEDGTRLEVTSGIPDVVRFERVHKMSFLKLGELTIEQLIWLGWCAAKRQRVTDLSFDEFLIKIADYTQDPVTTDPTRPAQ